LLRDHHLLNDATGGAKYQHAIAFRIHAAADLAGLDRLAKMLHDAIAVIGLQRHYFIAKVWRNGHGLHHEEVEGLKGNRVLSSPGDMSLEPRLQRLQPLSIREFRFDLELEKLA